MPRSIAPEWTYTRSLLRSSLGRGSRRSETALAKLHGTQGKSLRSPSTSGHVPAPARPDTLALADTVTWMLIDARTDAFAAAPTQASALAPACPTMPGKLRPTFTTTSASASTRLPSTHSACSSSGRFDCSDAASFNPSGVACDGRTMTVIGLQVACRSACALQLASHSASPLGPRTAPSQRGACHCPSQPAWHVASHAP
jgi:hypothetical protein